MLLNSSATMPPAILNLPIRRDRPAARPRATAVRLHGDRQSTRMDSAFILGGPGVDPQSAVDT